LTAIKEGDQKANAFMNEILAPGAPKEIDNIVRAFRTFRMLALKNNLKKNASRILVEKISENYMDEAIRLATEVFTEEQGIPAELIPMKDDLTPIWWCARVGEDIVGVVAAWQENDKWHWGRFAVDKGLRGMGIGHKMAIYSLKEIFSGHTEELYVDARDVTINLLLKFDCNIIGETQEFYGDTITPIVLNKEQFDKYLKAEAN
jgi:predicted GNAT family N-acyltransferase